MSKSYFDMSTLYDNSTSFPPSNILKSELPVLSSQLIASYSSDS